MTVPAAAPEADESAVLEWWERLREWAVAQRWLVVLLRLRSGLAWLALAVLLVAVVVWPVLRTALGAWLGCLWLVVCWFALARAKTVSWALVSGVLAAGMPVAGGIGAVSAWACARAGVAVDSTAASVVVASVVEELLKLVPLAVLALVAPGRARRLLASDWLVLGVASGAAFEAVEEVARRVSLLSGQGGLLDQLLCPGEGSEALECRGVALYSLSPFSGEAGDAFVYAGHALVTGLVAGAVGLSVALWRRCVHLAGWRALVGRAACAALPAWAWWVAVVDHMGRNASTGEVLWSDTGGQAPWWPVEATAAVTLTGHARGWVLLGLLAVAWVVDTRTLWQGGYTLLVEGDDGGGRWGPWRWHRLRGLPPSLWGRLGADLVDLVAVVGIEARLAWLTLVESAATRDPGLLARAPVNLRVAREEAVRAVLDPVPRRWWLLRLAALAWGAAAVVAVVVVVPALTRALAESLGEGGWFWLAGILDMLGQWWEGLSLAEKTGVVLLAGAVVVLSGGSLGLASQVGAGVTMLSSARGAAEFVRDPAGAAARYLSTRTPAEVALDLGLTALSFVGGGAAGGTGGYAVRNARWAANRAREEMGYAAWLWRTDRAVWRRYTAHRAAGARRYLADETGALTIPRYDPRAGRHYPGLRPVRRGTSEGGPGVWGRGRNYGSPRAQTYEEQVTGVRIEHSYYVNGVEFDGYNGFALVDAKGVGYAAFIKGRWSLEPKGRYGLIETAKRQVEAARPSGTPVHWHFAEEKAYKEMVDLQRRGEFPAEVELFCTPPTVAPAGGSVAGVV